LTTSHASLSFGKGPGERSDAGKEPHLFQLLKCHLLPIDLANSPILPKFHLMNIFLIGFMGSGKTTLGKKIASRLGYSFVDMDKAIEQEQGKSIPELFESLGEEKFRKIEADWLKKFQAGNTVVATGGGAPCHHTNLEIMKAKGTTVYLRSSPGNLAKRLFDSPASRPLINHVKHDLTGLTAFVTSKLAEREPFYNQSDVVFDSLNVDADKLNILISQVQNKP
jgi:shikimate kinase